MATRMQQRRDTAAQWTSTNPVLAAGELGVETDTGKAKIGDGSTAWASLAYAVGVSVQKSGDTMSGDLAMGTHRVTGLADPSAQQDAATRAFVSRKGLSYPMHVAADERQRRTYVFNSYNPTIVADTPSNGTANSYSDIDATNLAVSVICPPSGQIAIRLSAVVHVNLGTKYKWSIRESGLLVDETAIIVVDATSAATPLQLVSVTLLVAHEGAGSPGALLTPGKLYTFTWAHTSTVNSVNGLTQYGGTTGPATMEVFEVSNRITERALTATITTPPGNGNAMTSMADDGSELYGSGFAKAVSVSADDGATFTNYITSITGGGTAGVWPLADGELLLLNGLVPGTRNGSVWKTRGWATNRSTATLQKMLTVAGGNGVDDCYISAQWGISMVGDSILVNEYGPKVNAADMARYSYLSEDNGETWRTVFDLAASYALGPSVTGAHLHGCAIDPYWDALWIASGDAGSNHVLWLSLDQGATWRSVYSAHQFTSIYPLRECIILCSDEGNPNGIYRIPRIHPDRCHVELAFQLDLNASQTIVGSSMHRRRSKPDMPLLIATHSGSVSTPARLFATYDGYDIRNVWTDSSNYINQGLQAVVGPTNTGAYVGTLTRDGTTNLVFKLAPT